MKIVFIKISLDKRCNILTFPAFITFYGVDSLRALIFSVLAEWANHHSIRASVVATDSTTSRSDRAGTSFTTCFPDILTSGAHKSLLHQFLFFLFFLTQNIVPPSLFFLQELLFFFEKVFVRLLRRNARLLPISGQVFGSWWDFGLEWALILFFEFLLGFLSVHLWCQGTLSNLFIGLKSVSHSFIFGPDFMLVLFILLVMVLVPLILIRFECWGTSTIQT